MIAIHEAAAHNTANLPRRVAKRPPFCGRSQPMNEPGARELKLRFLLPEEAVEVQSCLDSLRQRADEGTVNRLVSIVARHLARLTSRRIPGRLACRESDEDLAQNVAIRLWNDLRRRPQEKVPTTPFLIEGLVYLKIRDTLTDLCRHHLGPLGSEAHREHRRAVRATDSGADVDFMGQVPDAASGPATSAEYAELHRLVSELPEDQREVFILRYYEAFSTAEISEFVHLDASNVRRRYHKAVRWLRQKLQGRKPSV